MGNTGGDNVARAKSALVFDEQHVAGFLAARAVRDAGYSVMEATATNEAIRKLRAGTFDLVFFNLKQTTGDFYRRALRIKRRAKGADRIICCVTCNDASACKLRRRGIVTLRKPFTHSDVLRLLESEEFRQA